MTSFGVIRFDIEPNDILIYKLTWALGQKDDDDYPSEDIHKYILIQAKTINFNPYTAGDKSLSCSVTEFNVRPSSSVHLEFDAEMAGVIGKNAFLIHENFDIRSKIMDRVRLEWYHDPTLVWSSLNGAYEWISSILKKFDTDDLISDDDNDACESDESECITKEYTEGEWSSEDVLHHIERLSEVSSHSTKRVWRVEWNNDSPYDVSMFDAKIVSRKEKGGWVYSVDFYKNYAYIDSDIKSSEMNIAIDYICRSIAYELNDKSKAKFDTDRVNSVLSAMQLKSIQV